MTVFAILNTQMIAGAESRRGLPRRRERAAGLGVLNAGKTPTVPMLMPGA
jgi:hypothetical protein